MKINVYLPGVGRPLRPSDFKQMTKVELREVCRLLMPVISRKFRSAK